MNDHETMGKPVGDHKTMTIKAVKLMKNGCPKGQGFGLSIEQRSSWINSYQKTSVLRLKMSTTYPSMVLQYQKYT